MGVNPSKITINQTQRARVIRFYIENKLLIDEEPDSNGEPMCSYIDNWDDYKVQEYVGNNWFPISLYSVQGIRKSLGGNLKMIRISPLQANELQSDIKDLLQRYLALDERVSQQLNQNTATILQRYLELENRLTRLERDLGIPHIIEKRN